MTRNKRSDQSEPFNGLEISLQGKNLIEASAGTGKTYSVAFLALRLIIEQQIPVEKILMVTFTEAAAAEMAERIRKFVRTACQYISGRQDKSFDGDIKNLIDRDKNKERTRELLIRASLSLDEICVYTIHSFCQRTLTEFAFETGQAFGSEIHPDESDLIASVVHEFWRKDYTILTEEQRHQETYTSLFIKVREVLKLQASGDADPLVQMMVEEYKRRKKELSLLSYDDLIRNLYDVAVSGVNKNALIQCLKSKYKAVFIDEFQDTDHWQYTIFSELFPGTLQFFIGDPKQSIYSFRNADLDSYLQAAREILRKYSMKVNYRSSDLLIQCLNTFYDIQQESAFQNEDILYKPVEGNHNPVMVTLHGKKASPLSISLQKIWKEAIYTQITGRVQDYLLNGKIVGKTVRDIRPSDIAILVRTNNKAKELRDRLLAVGIQAVTIDDTKILQTAEATLFYSLISLLISPSRSNLIGTLIHPYIGYLSRDIEQMNESAELIRIQELIAELPKSGIYAILHRFFSIYHDESVIRTRQGDRYYRMKSNVIQLIDLIHQKVTHEKTDIESVLTWMKRENGSNSGSGEGYEQRLESDEEAVRILTIHKSKGLEFNIVIMTTFPMFIDLHTQLEFCEEDLRLLYVGLTRGKYKTDLISSTYKKVGLDGLVNILERIRREKSAASFFDIVPYDAVQDMSGQIPGPAKANVQIKKPKAIDKSWRIASYSGLAKHSEFEPFNTEADLSDPYDQFVFRQMPRGADAGTFLHSLFEMADFTSSDFTGYLQGRQSEFPLFLRNSKGITWAENYNQLMRQVLAADYGGFTLEQTDPSKRRNEFEYHLRLKEKFDLKEINKILMRDMIRTPDELQGILKGYMDMFFEHDGKYYILDWKSNYLGDSLLAYADDKMEEAVQASSYDLQYIIYTVALCRFLKQRLPDFNYDRDFGGVYWVFLRGCRKGERTGVYYKKPDKKVIVALEEVFGGSD